MDSLKYDNFNIKIGLGGVINLRFIGSLVLLLVLDQISKLWIINNFTLGQSLSIIEGIFSITYIQNQGAAFGILQGRFWFFILAALFVISLVSYYNIKYAPPIFMQYISGLIVGGAVGNLIDRILYNAVIDFVSIGWFPVFNIADIGIVCGSIGLFLYLFFLDGGNYINENRNN